jgi:hypothetical protein
MSYSDLDKAGDTQVINEVRYQRTSRENPFLDLPKSGSLWGRDELDWLKVEDHCGLSPSDLLIPSADAVSCVTGCNVTRDRTWHHARQG